MEYRQWSEVQHGNSGDLFEKKYEWKNITEPKIIVGSSRNFPLSVKARCKWSVEWLDCVSWYGNKERHEVEWERDGWLPLLQTSRLGGQTLLQTSEVKWNLRPGACLQREIFQTAWEPSLLLTTRDGQQGWHQRPGDGDGPGEFHCNFQAAKRREPWPPLLLHQLQGRGVIRGVPWWEETRVCSW